MFLTRHRLLHPNVPRIPLSISHCWINTELEREKLLQKDFGFQETNEVNPSPPPSYLTPESAFAFFLRLWKCIRGTNARRKLNNYEWNNRQMEQKKSSLTSSKQTKTLTVCPLKNQMTQKSHRSPPSASQSPIPPSPRTHNAMLRPGTLILGPCNPRPLSPYLTLVSAQFAQTTFPPLLAPDPALGRAFADRMGGAWCR